MVLFGRGTLEKWTVFEVLDVLCEASGMAMNDSKSIFMEYGVDISTIDEFQRLFPFTIKYLEDGFKYSGFYLKPNNY